MRSRIARLYTIRNKVVAVCRFAVFAVAAYFENFFIMYKFFLICRFAAFFCRFCRYFKKKSGDDLDTQRLIRASIMNISKRK
jgi:hypothetical protein